MVNNTVGKKTKSQVNSSPASLVSSLNNTVIDGWIE